MEKAKETIEILAGIANKTGRLTANYITFTGHVHTPIVRGKL
jgi:hypothetical protein